MEVSNINSAQYTAGITGENINVKVTLNNGAEWFVPLDSTNNDYKVVLSWVDAGNTIEDAD
ncbi:MAG: hypothetical protein CMI76_04785 [Candidatus Pelagibacter sp.]|nr:hypothetical protein [Candidatus Pelagibacter sp.]MAJ66576.1 hypothetical protein [Candidatus Pelagibacter sp.]|tara:strand:+ start:60 stop:242 length:183 start_codon:yes stop_codon:yes gene_type:complete